MRLFCRKTLAITVASVFAISVSFMPLSAEPVTSKPSEIEPIGIVQDDVLPNTYHSKPSKKPAVERKLTELECEYLDVVQRFSCIVNGRKDRSLDIAGMGLGLEK